MKVFLSELAESKLLKLSEYLLEEWNLKTRDKFISKLNDKIKQISNQPDKLKLKKDIG
ncbi:MAG TPA: type II toxin-antitoxin system RelE/ParE family toxin [Flavobacterium sp.]|nr:type II toxin-antitoxin system RelE/ParE family toxin [Flavobacterium sp.]